MALTLPQPNNSRIKIPAVPNYLAVLEAYGFHRASSDGRSYELVRIAPDDNGYEGAWQYRLSVPEAFESEIQRRIEILN